MSLFLYRWIRNTSIVISCILIQSTSFALPSIEGIQIYQKNLHLSDEHRQKLADDIDRYHNADNLWESLREEFTLPHYEDNPDVQDEIDFFLKHHHRYLNEVIARSGPYLYFVFQQVKKRHLPVELVLIPMIESNYNSLAYSSAGASGIWQMMPGTASGYGIRRDKWYDGRRDVVASTRAALNYLSYLNSFFDGNWLLAIAAYDTGEGNILAAIQKNTRQGKRTDFWSLPLSSETRRYVPRLLALATIISHPELYPVKLPYLPNAPYLAQMDVGAPIHLKQAAKLAGMHYTTLKQLNSAYRKSATAPHGPFKLILPIEHVERFSENLAKVPAYRGSSHLYYAAHKRKSNTVVAVAHKKTRAHLTLAEHLKNMNRHYVLRPGDTLYIVRQGDTVEKIAEHYQVSTQAILAINQSQSKKLSLGASLIIPTHLNQQVHKYNLSPNDTVYLVRKGDTIEKVANKFHASPAVIRMSNLLASNNLREGDPLVIPEQLADLLKPKR